MASTGFTLAGTGANAATIGTEAWASPGNVTADDGSNASGAAAAKDEQMNYLVGSNYGFAIPTGSTINGIEVRFQASDAQNGSGTASDITNVVVGKSNAALGSDLGDGTLVATTPTNYTYGSASELWGLSWTAAEINASTFQFRISMNVGVNATFSAGGDPLVDVMWINVHYTPPPARTQMRIMG